MTPTHPPAQASDEPTWLTSDLSFVLAHLKENTIFDTARIQREWGEMKALAMKARSAESVQASDEPMRAALPPMPKEECLLVGVYAHRSSTMAKYGAACFAAGQAATPRATADVERESCAWTYDEGSEAWASACGDLWSFIDGGPNENSVKFCQGCGKPLTTKGAKP